MYLVGFLNSPTIPPAVDQKITHLTPGPPYKPLMDSWSQCTYSSAVQLSGITIFHYFESLLNAETKVVQNI